MALPHAEIHHFRHNGYLKCRDLLPAETVTELKETILKDIAKEAEPTVRDKTDRVVRISQVLDRDPIYLKAASHSPLLDTLESLLGPQIELVKNRHNHANGRLLPPRRRAMEPQPSLGHSLFGRDDHAKRLHTSHPGITSFTRRRRVAPS